MSEPVAEGSDGTQAETSSGHYVPKHRQSSDHLRRHGGDGSGRRSTARRVLIGMNMLIALAIIASGTVVGYAAWRLNQIKRVHVAAVVPVGRDPQSQVLHVKVLPGHKKPAPPETFLIVGSDTRAGLDQPGDTAYGNAATVGGARSDTIILARVVPATKQIVLLSIPRDTYLDIPGLGMQKINAALGKSPNLLVQVIESKYGIDINHYVDVDFDSFKDIADALGGVEVYFPTEVRDVNAGLYIGAPGCVNLTGNLALAFVRSREYTYYIPGRGWQQESLSDLARIQRQQIFIRKLAAKAKSEGLGNPLTLDQIIGGLTKNLTVDDTLSNEDLVKLAVTFRSVNPADIQGWTMPASGETLRTSTGPDDVLIPEAAQDQAMVTSFLAYGESVPSTVTAGSTVTATPATVAGGAGTAGSATTATTGSATTAPSSTAATKGRTAKTVPTTSTLPASSIAVTVVNGSDVTGQAGRTALALRALHFDVVGTETASTFGHSASVVEYGPGGQAAARTVAAHLEGAVTLQQSSGFGSKSVEIITGTALSGVSQSASVSGPTTSASTATSTSATSTSATPSSSAAPTTSTSTTSTVPASTTTTYALPGTPSTGAPACPT